MTERYFRLILGSILIILLTLQNDTLVYAYIALLLFEGLTNWRITLLISRLRKLPPHGDTGNCASPINFESERLLRLVIAALLIITYIIYPDILWFFPWFIAFMLFMAGVTNICPMTMFFSWLGFR